MEVLTEETAALGGDTEALVTGEWKDPGNAIYPRPIGFNVIPLAGSMGDQGYTDEE